MSGGMCDRRTGSKLWRRLYRVYQHLTMWFITALFIFGGWLFFVTRVAA